MNIFWFSVSFAFLTIFTFWFLHFFPKHISIFVKKMIGKRKSEFRYTPSMYAHSFYAGAGHCLDMYALTGNDSRAVKDAYRELLEWLKRVIAKNGGAVP